jgi:membrane-associated phospholipid phosphatase
LGYLAFTLVVIAARAERIPGAPALWALNAGLFALVLLLARTRVRAGRVGAVLAEWYPLAFFVVFFEEIDALVHAFADGWYDHTLIAADRLLFGTDPTVWLERFTGYWLTEYCQLAYTSYFPLTVGVAFYLWIRHGREAFRLLMLASCAAYYSCYVIFLVFPTESPYHALRHLQRIELHGGPFTALIDFIERYGRVHGGAFPSAHVAGSVVALLAAWRFSPRLGRWLVPVVASIMVATVYGRYHYVVDVLASVVVAGLGFAAAIFLQRRLHASA